MDGRLPVREYEGVGRRFSATESIWEHGATAFAFLIEEWDFLGPERHDDGVAYHRPDLHVIVEWWAWKNEAGFETLVKSGADRYGRCFLAPLDRLYASCGLGSIHTVPMNGAGAQHVIRTRIDQHSRALRQVMSFINGPGAKDVLRGARS